MNPSRRRNDPAESEAHFHRRKTDADAVLALHSRVDDHDKQLELMHGTMQALSSSFKELADNVGRLATVLEVFSNLRGAWNTLKMLGAAAKVLLVIAAGCGALWGAFKFLVWLAGVKP